MVQFAPMVRSKPDEFFLRLMRSKSFSCFSSALIFLVLMLALNCWKQWKVSRQKVHNNKFRILELFNVTSYIELLTDNSIHPFHLRRLIYQRLRRKHRHNSFSHIKQVSHKTPQQKNRLGSLFNYFTE